MSTITKKVFAGVLALLGLLLIIPVTRDEIRWRWAISKDGASDYMGYFNDWPNGRHAAEARLFYNQRVWQDTKKAMIHEAYRKSSLGTDDPLVRKEHALRRERFYWAEVTNADTMGSYRDYLARYPGGLFADQARTRLTAVNRK